jgi:hypothetical protein
VIPRRRSSPRVCTLVPFIIIVAHTKGANEEEKENERD